MDNNSNNEQLVNEITRLIMERIQADAGSALGQTASATGTMSSTVGSQVVCFGDVPSELVNAGFAVRAGRGVGDTDGVDYIVLSQAAFRAFHGGAIPAGLTGLAPVPASGSACVACADPHLDPSGGDSFDLTAKKLISERDLKALALTSGCVVKVAPTAIVTSLAKDLARSAGAEIVS